MLQLCCHHEKMQLDVEENTPTSDMTYWFHSRIAIGNFLVLGFDPVTSDGRTDGRTDRHKHRHRQTDRKKGRQTDRQTPPWLTLLVPASWKIISLWRFLVTFLSCLWRWSALYAAVKICTLSNTWKVECFMSFEMLENNIFVCLCLTCSTWLIRDLTYFIIRGEDTVIWLIKKTNSHKSESSLKNN